MIVIAHPPPAAVPFLDLAVIPEVLQPPLYLGLVLVNLRGEEGGSDGGPFPAKDLPDPGGQNLFLRRDLRNLRDSRGALFHA